MRAILTYVDMEDGEIVKHTRLFDTDRSEKLDLVFVTGSIQWDVYVSRNGIPFLYSATLGIKLLFREKIKQEIAEKMPDKYMEIWGPVEEA